MWRFFESLSRQIQHIEKPRIYHGEHCALCRIRNAKASQCESEREKAKHGAIRAVPTSRDLLVGPDRWTRRFVALEDPSSKSYDALPALLEQGLLFTRVPFDGIDTVTPLTRLSEKTTGDDVIILVSPHPMPATDPAVVQRLCRRAHPQGQLILVWTTPMSPRQAVEYTKMGRGISTVCVYQEGGRAIQVPDVAGTLAACLGERSFRLSWADLVPRMESGMHGWRVFAHNAWGDDKRTFFGF